MMRELHELHVGKALLDEGVSVFPIWIGAPAVSGYSWEPGAVRFTERAGGAAVGELDAVNTTRRPAIALEGDLAEGGQQHRMVARSLVLEPGERRPVDALCVEQGRWHGASGFVRTGRRASSSIREASRRGTDAQGEVWRSIQHLDHTFVGSPTSSLLHHLDGPAAPLPRLLDGQRGVIIGIGGRVLGAELYGSTTALRSRWRGIIEGARLDARRGPWRVTHAETARAFARIIEQLQLDSVAEAGAAVAIEGSRGGVRGTGIATAGNDWGLPVAAAESERLLHLALSDASHPLLAPV